MVNKNFYFNIYPFLFLHITMKSASIQSIKIYKRKKVWYIF